MREGFKKTEVGGIPIDWDVKAVSEIASITTGGKNTQDRVEDGAYPFFVRSQIVEAINSFTFDGEAVLTAGDGVGTGKIFHYINGKFDYHQRVYKIYGFKPEVDGFYFYKFFSRHFYDRIMSMTAKSSVDSVRREMISDMKIVLPPHEEQKEIAKALSDVDELILSLEKLIAKKQDIKTATMQQLLTGKKRLPGFGEGKGYKQTELGEIPEDWDISSLSEACSFINDGTHHTPKYVKNGVPFYSVENVTADDFENTKYISKEEHLKLIKRCKPQKGDILLTRIGTLGKTKLIDWDVDASIYVSLALLKLKEFLDSSYVYAYSKSRKFEIDVEKRSLTNATPQKINMNEIGQVPIVYPKEFSEQSQIAAVILDQMKEIELLETRLNKTKAIKQGMMQELLTGRTRLVDVPVSGEFEEERMHGT